MLNRRAYLIISFAQSCHSIGSHISVVERRTEKLERVVDINLFPFWEQLNDLSDFIGVTPCHRFDKLCESLHSQRQQIST